MNKLFFLLFLAFTACNRPATSLNEDQSITVDSAVVNENSTDKPAPATEDLTSFFNKQKSKDGYLIQPKNIKANGDGFYCYFNLKNDKAAGLRLRIQFWETAPQGDYYSFDVDGNTTVYNANHSNSESGNSRVVENVVFNWYDNSINQEDQRFLQSIATATTVKVSLISTSTNKVINVITISENDKKNIGRALDYYFALNGPKIPKKGMVNIRD